MAKPRLRGSPTTAKSVAADFAFMARAKRLVVTESTFSFWAAFLGDAHEVHAPSAGVLPALGRKRLRLRRRRGGQRRTGASIMRRRGAWRIGMGGAIVFSLLDCPSPRWIGGHGRGRQPRVFRAASAAPGGTPRELCRAAGRRPCASLLPAAQLSQSSWDLHLNNEKTRFSRSAPSGRTYRPAWPARAAARHTRLLALLVKVKHTRCQLTARP